MKNKEKYKDKIIEIAIKGCNFAMNKDGNEIKPCRDISCDDCYFMYRDNLANTHNCMTNKRMWANEEAEFTHEEKVEKLQEYCRGRECENCVFCNIRGYCEFEALSATDKELGTDVINKMYKMIEG